MELIGTNMTMAGSEGPPVQCATVCERVYEFLDEELSPAERERIAGHLSSCPPCAGHFAFERAFLAVLHRRVTIDQAPAELRDRIRATLASLAEETRRRS
jgi:mycothiol system anti-sigma-R factor